MKTVLFIPEYWYLSLELFSAINRRLGKDVRRVFLETGDPFFISTRNKHYTDDWFENRFNHTHFLEFPTISKKSIKSIVDIYSYQKEFKKIIKTYRPDLVITTGDRNHFYPLVRHCLPEIPIVIIQGALLHLKYYINETKSKAPLPAPKKSVPDNARRLLIDSIKRIFYGIVDIPPLSVDCSTGWGLQDNRSYLFLWGAITEALFKNHRDNLFCMGNPLTDSLFDKYSKHNKDMKLLNELDLELDREVVLISAPCFRDTGNIDDAIQYYKSVTDKCKSPYYLIKVHPRDDIENFKAFTGRSNVRLVKDEYSFRELLRISDLNISHYSATSMDAAIYGVPIILLPQNILNPQDLTYWFGTEIFYKPLNVDDCIQNIQDMLSGTDEKKKKFREIWKEFVLDMFSEHAGHSMTAVIGKINELLSSSSRR